MRANKTLITLAVSIALASPHLTMAKNDSPLFAKPQNSITSLNLHEILTSATDLTAEGNLPEAIKQIRSVLARQPQNAEARYLYGNLLSRIGAHKEAIQNLAFALKLTPQNRQYHIAYAKAFVAANKLEAAEAEYRVLESQSIYSKEKREIRRLRDLVKGQRFLNNGDLQAALDHFLILAQKYTDEVAVLQALGHIYTQLGYWEEAETYLVNATGLAPKNATTYRMLGSLYHASSDLEGQRSYMQQAIELDPFGVEGLKSKQLLVQFGNEALENGKTEQALLDYQSVLQLDPHFDDAQVATAKAYEVSGRLDEARIAYKQILKTSPGNLEALTRLANISFKQDNIDESISLYQQLIETTSDKRWAREARNRLNLLFSRKAELLSHTLDNKDDVKAALEIIDSWIKDNQIDSASWLLSRIIEMYPQNAKGNYYLGLILSKQGRMDQAKEALARATWSDPESTEFRLAYAQVVANTGDLDNAEAVYRDVVMQAAYPSTQHFAEQQIGYIVGEKYIRAKKFHLALSHYRDLLKKDPRDIRLLQRIGDIYAAQGNMKAAEKTLNDIAALQKRIKAEEQALAKGRQYAQQHRYDEAKEILSKLTEGNGANPEAFYWLGSVYAQTGDTDKALSLMRSSLSLAPKNLTLKKEFARTLVKAGKLRLAQEQYEEVLMSISDKTQRKEITRLLDFIKGQRMVESGEYQHALKHYETMRMVFPKDIDVLQAYARTAIELSLWEKAEEAYGQILDYDPNKLTTHILLANLFDKKGDNAMRLAQLSKAMQKDPASRASSLAIQSILKSGKEKVAAGQLDEAMKEYETLLTIFPAHIDAGLAMAELYTKKGKLDDAQEIYRKIIALRPLDLESRSKLAELYVQQDTLDPALNEYQKIYDISPNSELGQNANAKLNFLYGRKAEQLSKNLETSTLRDRAIRTAIQWIGRDRLSAAQWLLTAILDQHPDFTATRYWIGQVHLKKHELSIAREYFSEAFDREPNNARYILSYADILANLGENRDAKKLYNKVVAEKDFDTITKQTAEEKLSLLIGEKLIKDGKESQALRHFRQLQAKKPDDVYLMERIAHILLLKNKTKDAREILDQALELDPNNVKLNNSLATLYKQEGNNKAYLKQLRLVFLLDPNGGLGLNLAKSLGLSEGLGQLHKGQYKAAITAFNRSLEANPNNLFASVGISAAYMESGLKNDAENTLSHLLSIDSNTLDTRLRFLMLKGSYAQQ